MKRTVTKISAGAAALVIAAGTGAATYAALDGGGTTTVAPASSAATAQSVKDGALTIGEVYDRANASAVEITVTTQAPAQGPMGSGTAQAQGSGFVYDTSGHVITNAHVVDGAESVKVRFADGKSYDATVVGVDASTDLAVLKVDAPASALHPIELADSSQVAVGDVVVAIGSPFGLENSVTAGIVSALGRSMQAPNGYTITGADPDRRRDQPRQLGRPAARPRRQGRRRQRADRERVGRQRRRRLRDPVEHRRLDRRPDRRRRRGRARLPRRVRDRGDRRHGGRAARPGARAAAPAAKAGLQAGDVVTAVDGDTVASAAALQSAIDAKKPGDRVIVDYLRNGERRTVTVTLATRPS